MCYNNARGFLKNVLEYIIIGIRMLSLSVWRRTMTCFEAQCLMTPFINEELNNEQVEGFLEHVKHCVDCKDDLEVYYTLLNGMKQLDENKNIANNFHIDLDGFLHKQEEKILQEKSKKIQKRIILCLFMLLLGLWFA